MIKVTQFKVTLAPALDLALRAESPSKLGVNHGSKGRLIKSNRIQEILLNHTPPLVKINYYFLRVLRGGVGTVNYSKFHITLKSYIFLLIMCLAF